MITSGLGRGGSELQLFHLATGLARRDWRVEVISLQPSGPYLAEFRAQGIRVTVCPVSRLATPRRFRRLFDQLCELNPSIVHTQAFRADLWGRVAAIRAGIPVVASIRATYAYLPRAFRPVERALSRYTAMLITPSVAARDFLVQTVRIPPDRVVVIPNGVDTSQFGDQTLAQAFRDERGLGSAFVVLFAGRLVHQKKPDVALRSYQRFALSWPHSILVIAGRGPLDSPLRRQAREGAARVEFVGELDRRGMVQAVSAADVILLMSEFEGSPNIVLEAMAAGKPVVASAIGGVAELVETNLSGILVEPGDVDSAAKALQRLAASEPLRRLMGESAQTKIKRDHTIEGNLDAHIALYDRVLAAGKNTGRKKARCRAAEDG